MATPSTNRPLTKTQLDYALNKLTDAYDTRCAKAVENVAHPGPAPALTAADKYKLIASGKAKLLPYNENDRYPSLYMAYSYPDFEAAQKKHSAASTVYAQKCAQAQKPVLAQYNAAKDTLVMGSAEAALAVVEAFAAGK